MNEDLQTSDPVPNAREEAMEPPPIPGDPHRVDRLLEVGIWVLLMLTVLAIFGSTLMPVVPGPGALTGRLELQFQAKYAVGVHELYSRFGLDVGDQMDEQLLTQVRSLAASPTERLCLVPLIAELRGVEAALSEVTALHQSADLPEDAVRDLDLLDRLYNSGDDADQGEVDVPLTQEEQAGFVERRKWFAQLALSQSGQEMDRPAVLAEAIRVALVMIAMVMLIGGGSVLGLGLLVTSIIIWRRQGFRTHYQPYGATADPGAREFDPHLPASTLAARRLPFFETVVVFILALALGIPLFVHLLMRLTGLEDVPLILTLLAAPAVLWPWLRGVRGEEIRQAYGLYRGGGVFKEIGFGLLGYLAGAPLLIFSILVSALLATLVKQTPHHPIMDEVSQAGWAGILAIYLVACVSAPVLEEIVFRGGFFHYLRSRFKVLPSAFLVSVVFAFIHPQGILGVPPLIALAMILAMIREWRGSIIGPIAVHALHNGITTTFLLLLLG